MVRKGRYGIHNLSGGGQIDIPYAAEAVLASDDYLTEWNDIDVGSLTTVQRLPIGTILRRNGKVYAYTEFGGTVAVARLVSSELPDAVHDVLPPVAALAGATNFDITSPASGSADFIVNEYAGGTVYSGTGNGTPGYGYSIATHEALDISEAGTMNVVLAPSENLVVALAATDDMAFVKNPWKEVIISATTLIAPIVGVTLAAVVDGNFGWVGCKGLFPVLTAGSLINGEAVKISGTAGPVMIPEHEEATDAGRSRENTGNIGVCADIGANGEFSLIALNGLGVV